MNRIANKTENKNDFKKRNLNFILITHFISDSLISQPINKQIICTGFILYVKFQIPSPG